MASGTIKNNRIFTGNIRGNYTAAANGGRAQANLKALIDADMPSGASCIGVVGVGTGAGGMCILTARYLDAAYALDLRNITNASISSVWNVEYAYQF